MAYTTIDDPETYFQTQLYTGNGSANHAITLGGDTDMQPDLVWIKNRDAADSHCLFDSVRGATKVIHSDATGTETTDTDTLDSFTSDGFQVDADVKVNTNTEKYVAWCWKAGTTSGINATGADLSTTGYSFNQTSGFSIIKYTGNLTEDQAFPHGLGAVPHMVMCRTLANYGWAVYHRGTNGGSDPEDYGMKLETSSPQDNSDGWWYDTAPTSVLVTVSNGDDNNQTGSNMAYCFTSIQGFSKFGSYTGNGNTNGTFVYTGFRPSLVIVKISSGTTGSWCTYSSKVLGYNDDNDEFLANDPGVPGVGNNISIYSNGFKMLKTTAETNGSGNSFVYMAWAEAPFVNSKGVPCNAR